MKNEPLNSIGKQTTGACIGYVTAEQFADPNFVVVMQLRRVCDRGQQTMRRVRFRSREERWKDNLTMIIKQTHHVIGSI
jgi:hypothetical protein